LFDEIRNPKSLFLTIIHQRF